MGLSPNAISLASVFFAALAAAGFFLPTSQIDAPSWIGWLVAILGIQGRLLCNLMDGMVAVEGNRKSVTGELWNEVPDRVADTVILLAAGYASTYPWLGVAAALGALLTAYLRALGASLTSQQDFRGPMAKPHRMALLTAAAALCIILPFWSQPILDVSLSLLILGVTWTCWRRLTALARELKRRSIL